MKTQIEQLGKVCFTIDKNYHDINRDYDKLVITESYDEGVAYASRKPVPAGTPLTDREYWIKFSSLKEHIQQNYNVIQQELNALYDKVGVGITFSGDYSTFDVGKSKTITLSFATVNAAEKASIVKLYQSDTLMDTYNNISEFTKEVTVSDEVTFRVVATIGSYTYSATWEVTRAYDWYIGGGATHEAVMIDANKHSGTDESISSIQSVNINNSGDHIFICVQKDIFLPEVTMNGFTVPFDAPYTAIVDDVEYNVYKSSNAYTVNTYILKIDAANWDEDEIFRNLISVVTGFDSETEDLQNRMETAEAVYLRQGRQISSIIDRIDPLIERTGGGGDDAQPIRRGPSPWDEYRGMKHIQLLPKEEEGAVLTQDDFAEENTIYVIQYDYELGENITIPENCVLEFDGGSISGNSILTFQNTFLFGSPRLDCNFAGQISNDLFNVLWISSGDIGYKVNKAGEVFKKLLIPQGEYVYTTPIALEGIQKVVSEAILYYNGEYINNTGIFKIKKAWGAYIYVYHLKPKDNSIIDYTDQRNTNTVGLEIQSCNNCEIHFMRAEYFNENLRISDINHSGCSYNKFFIGVLASANANIRLYQHDAANGISWTNENTFVGGRLTHWTDTKQWGDYWNIAAGGPLLDKPSYRISGAVDNEDTINGLTFVGTSIESPKITLLLRNVTDSQFIGMRQETNPGFAKIIGVFDNIYYIPKFVDSNNIVTGSDLSEAKNISIANFFDLTKSAKTINIDDNITADGKLATYSGYICNSEGLIDAGITYLAMVGALVSDKYCVIRANKRNRFAVRFIDSEGNNVTENYRNNIIGYQISYNSTQKAFVSITDVLEHHIHIPDGVYKAVVGSIIIDGGVTVHVYAPNTIETPNIAIKGSTSSRPVALPVNIPYYNIDKNLDEYWSGTSWAQRSHTVAVHILNNLDESNNTLDDKYVAHNCFIADDSGLKFNKVGTYLTKKGCVLDTTLGKDKSFKAEIDIYSRFVIMFLNENNENISETYEGTISFTLFSYNSTEKAFVSITDMKTCNVEGIPSEVTKVFVGVFITTYPKELKVTHDNVSVNMLRTVGTLSEVPVGLPKGVPFYAIDIKKNIYYTGDTSGGLSGWVDSLGQDVPLT